MEIRIEKDIVFFDGILNETVTEKKLIDVFERPNSASSPIFLDFSNTKRSNSSGIAVLLRALKRTQPHVRFTHCPVWLVDQLNQISEFFTVPIKVHSVFLPYECENPKEEDPDSRMKILEVGPHMLDPDFLRSLDEFVSPAGSVYTAEFEPREYLGFYRFQAQSEGTKAPT